MVGSSGGGGGGTGGGAHGGIAGGDGWKVQNSKGRSRPDPNEWPLPSSRPQKKVRFSEQADGKGRGKGKEQDEDEVESFANQCREEFKDDPAMLLKLDEKYPPKKLEPKELMQKAMDDVELLKAAANHQQKQHSQMDTAYLRRSEELLEYGKKLQAQAEKAQQAQAAFRKAELDLAAMQAQAASASAPFVAVMESDPRQMVSAYNPMPGIVQSLSAVPGMEQLPWDFAQNLQAAMESCFKMQMGMWTGQMRLAPTVQAAISTPVADLPLLSQVVADAGGMGSAGHAAAQSVAGDVAGNVVGKGVDSTMPPAAGTRRTRENFEEDDIDLFDEADSPPPKPKDSATIIRQAEFAANSRVASAKEDPAAVNDGTKCL